MSEDVIEFGTAVKPGRRPKLYRLPQVYLGPASITASLGVLGVVLSFFGNWQSTTLPDDNSTREIGAALAALGPVSAAYVVISTGAVAATMIALFGQPSARGTARILGFALAGMGLALVSSMAFSLSKTSTLADFNLFPSRDLINVRFELEWGIWTAFAGMLALAAALVLAIRPVLAAAGYAATASPYEEPADMDLEVSVFPASPKASPGAGNELYMRQ